MSLYSDGDVGYLYRSRCPLVGRALEDHVSRQIPIVSWTSWVYGHEFSTDGNAQAVFKDWAYSLRRRYGTCCPEDMAGPCGIGSNTQG